MIALLVACAGGLGLGRATVTPVGVTRWSGGAEVSVATATFGPEQEAPLPWLTPVVGVRRGVAPGWDVGARAWGSGWPGLVAVTGAATDVRAQLGRADDGQANVMAAGLVVALNQPRVGDTPFHLASAEVPLWVGIPMDEDELTLMPRVGAALVTSRGQSPFVTPRLGFGVALHHDRHGRDIAPQVAWGWSPVPFDGTLEDPARRGFHTLEVGVVFAQGR